MPTENQTTGRRAWDPLVRLTHWTIALTIVVNGVLLRDGDFLHIWIGYVALSALILRLLWGFIALGSARFAEMPLAPVAALSHLQDLVRGRWHDSPGHTPLGAWMAVSIWLLLAVTAATGLGLHADPFPDDETHHSWSDYHVDDDDDDDDDDWNHNEGSETLEDVHEAAATGLLILAALHIAGIGLESQLSGVNLARAMFRPRRERPRK
ncbi:cytochrome b/b6 domain-containing protein [Alisedimentitalea sp. MJ-SS2]|uniref:cytochrome b/b6 domain-containing protein n=1 Tax=Aliisedimentitalea sp. MJ-SS2 TaxID=3049795 RepID=UPI002914B925|nr:cytochrome b/b6 domain-containing protein [Alisedimentitalea sp. MJ-SS2]MDU8927626.1 cytochrome b/b6 domain-containing protein [Alisedimentitalea sp. MJ-SS2]